MPAIGELVDGRYKLLRHIGMGSFGEVWEAEDLITPGAPHTAIKIFWGNTEPDEIRLLSRLDHPFTLRFLDVTKYYQRACMVTELAEGSLFSRYNRKATPPEEAAPILLGIAAGLTYLHFLTPEAMIHRDIKPENILLRRGVPKIGDVGIAKYTPNTHTIHSGAMTQAYSAPEMWPAPGSPPDDPKREVGPKSDVFAFGLLAYELLCGELPGNTMLPYALLLLGPSDPTPPPMPTSIPEPLRSVVHRCLRKHRKSRPAAQDVVYEIASVVRSYGSWLPGSDERRETALQQIASITCQALEDTSPPKSGSHSRISDATREMQRDATKYLSKDETEIEKTVNFFLQYTDAGYAILYERAITDALANGATWKEILLRFRDAAGSPTWVF